MEQIIHNAFQDSHQLMQFTNEAVDEMIGDGGLERMLAEVKLSPGLFQPIIGDIGNLKDTEKISFINQALILNYGLASGSGLALRTGRLLFSKLLRNCPGLGSICKLEFRVKPISQKIILGLPVVAELMASIGDQQTTIEDHEQEIHYIVRQCSDCIGLHEEKQPVCYLTLGILKEALYWLSSSHEYRINETQCLAMGDSCCRFVIQKKPI
jgi:hypothetical protein